MATKKQKQELVDILKFTPIKVNLSLQGYGGESYAGKIDRKIYDFFKENKYDIEEYASDWDGEWYDRVPEDLQPFPSGSAFECDNLWHASGAELSNLNQLTIIDENGKDIWEHSLGHDDLEDSGVSVTEGGGCDLDDLEEGTVVFVGGQGEKGCFFDAEFTLRSPFDPKKLTIFYENCDGWYIITSVEYDGEELDGFGAYSTTGKWAENKWVIVGDEEVYEAVSMEDREEGYTEYPTEEEIEELDQLAENDKTEWFDKNIKPYHKGEYEVCLDAAWPLSGMIYAEWTGRSWKDSEGKKVKITQWRGLKEPM